MLPWVQLPLQRGPSELADSRSKGLNDAWSRPSLPEKRGKNLLAWLFRAQDKNHRCIRLSYECKKDIVVMLALFKVLCSPSGHFSVVSFGANLYSNRQPSFSVLNWGLEFYFFQRAMQPKIIRLYRLILQMKINCCQNNEESALKRCRAPLSLAKEAKEWLVLCAVPCSDLTKGKRNKDKRSLTFGKN